MRKPYLQVLIFFLLLLLQSCGAYFNQPFTTQKARIGENTSSKSILDGILPIKETIVGVYKFRDQTGQYKPVDNGSTFSTAVTQGGTAILLKSLEDSKWFNPIERENISNLLNERQIIRSTRQEYAKNSKEKQVTSLPPLLFAGIIIEGGIVSFDSNIITGGTGARYFGAGGSSEYREDRITVYLRAVSTSSGRILKNVYVSKTILSQGISANLFRYVKLRRLLEVETGVTKNEPAQLAVKEAIDKAVQNLIIEGIIDGLWKPQGGEAVVEKIKEKYDKEKEEAASTALLNRKLEDRRGKAAISITAGSANIEGDYGGSKGRISTSMAYKLYFKKPNLNLNLGVGYLQLENEKAFKDDFVSLDINLEYDFLPYEDLSPFAYAGVGTISKIDMNNPYAKLQFGLGLEYLPVPNVGIKLFGEQNVTFTDKLDGLAQGKRDDYFWRFGVGLNFYFGKPYKRVKSVIFE
ncbi:MAG: CsgG/HfaB family protein [Lutibacter sp.]|jgi:curli production assembly/transport component CsgG|uniref:CsgG/HfaB family protein n=1 Tax=Lutibacter sp. TaxID=1925666 RepID=UPI00299CDCCD|nr:CsgG/HfaB family protein [Lutibacter sp.]MDX1830266.1 CsgG/HfaB family protein [Lutibacter sp.]